MGFAARGWSVERGRRPDLNVLSHYLAEAQINRLPIDRIIRRAARGRDRRKIEIGTEGRSFVGNGREAPALNSNVSSTRVYIDDVYVYTCTFIYIYIDTFIHMYSDRGI